MTYVSQQTSAELRQHMRRLLTMPGWHEPLADRLWREIQELDKELVAVRSRIDQQTGKET